MATLDLQVSASNDDVQLYSASTILKTYVYCIAGRYDATYYNQRNGIRFQNVTVPQGSTITAAYITYTAGLNNSNACQTTIYGEDEDNASDFATETFAGYAARTRTTAYVKWGKAAGYDAIGDWVAESEYSTPSTGTNADGTKDIVQEIVNRASWASGNAMVFFWDNDGSSGADNRRVAYSYDGSTSKAPKLHIEYVSSEFIPKVIIL